MHSVSLCLLTLSLSQALGWSMFDMFQGNNAGAINPHPAVRISGDKDRFIPAICLGPCIQNDCQKKETRWYYNIRKGGCRKFKGCVGSGNNFPSEDSCEALCEDQEDPCADLKCKECEICDGGRCIWDEGLCPRSPPECSPRDCYGPCRYCQRGRCMRRPRCITIPRTPAPTLPPMADPCENVQCPNNKCYMCIYGKCVRKPMCYVKPRCRTRCPRRCERCVVGRCQPIRDCPASPFPPQFPKTPQQPKSPQLPTGPPIPPKGQMPWL